MKGARSGQEKMGSYKQCKLRPYQHCYMELSVQADCILWRDRIFVPPAGQLRVLDVLHDGHPGICHMMELTTSFVW